MSTSFHPSSPVDPWGNPPQFLPLIQPTIVHLSDAVMTAPPAPSSPPRRQATGRPQKKAASATATNRRKTAAKDAQKTPARDRKTMKTKCPACTKELRADNLLRHVRNSCGEGNPVQVVCDCKKTFSRPDAVTRHKASGTCTGSRRTRREAPLASTQLPADFTAAPIAAPPTADSTATAPIAVPQISDFTATAPFAVPQMSWPMPYHLANAQAQQPSDKTFPRIFFPQQPFYVPQRPMGDWRLLHNQNIPYMNIQWPVANGAPLYANGDGFPMTYPPAFDANQVYYPQPQPQPYSTPPESPLAEFFEDVFQFGMN